ncbi:MAG: tRNA (adenosine(37)-N6)-threonylcarbamoyltransferase complex dimerization subunit type 1 TsaB [Eubacteriales bacterium]|jgi:tRNA threonylcarbamoyladenosine biosynthesis protein TsaB
MIVLGVDSSARSASVAVAQEDVILGESFLNNGLTHSQTLQPMVDHLLEVLGMTLADIDVMAVNSGPGSFTGIRIGVAAVKGMAFARDTACVGVSTLYSLARNVGPWPGLICAAMDARCGQVYNALFRQGEKGLERLCEDRAITVSQLAQELAEWKKSVIFVGDGAALCYNNISKELQDVVLAPENIRYARGSSVALAGRELYDHHRVSSFELVPTYLRPSQAERERTARMEAARAAEQALKEQSNKS